MIITKKWLTKPGACEKGIKAFVNQKEMDSTKIIKLLIRSNNKEQLDWANWLICRVFKTKKQKVLYAIYAARLVLPIFEAEYPDNLGPRKAIEAAEAWVENPCEKNRAAAGDAAWAASEVAWAAGAATRAAALTTWAAAGAARVAWAATRAAGVAWAAARIANNNYNKTMTQILNYGLSLLNT